jgi:small subunit ribosomal protein S15
MKPGPNQGWAQITIYIRMLEKKKKQQIIKKFQLHEGDTGSNEVQIAILAAEIEELASHLKSHHKDHSSRRGLLRKVSSRRNLMRYLKKENPASYEELVKKLKIKPVRVITKADGATVEVEEDLSDDVDIIGQSHESAA